MGNYGVNRSRVPRGSKWTINRRAPMIASVIRLNSHCNRSAFLILVQFNKMPNESSDKVNPYSPTESGSIEIDTPASTETNSFTATPAPQVFRFLALLALALIPLSMGLSVHVTTGEYNASSIWNEIFLNILGLGFDVVAGCLVVAAYFYIKPGKVNRGRLIKVSFSLFAVLMFVVLVSDAMR